MRATIDRFEGMTAVLHFDGNQELLVSREELPKDAHEGMVLFVLVSDSANEEEAREKLAKSILNEILNNEV